MDSNIEEKPSSPEITNQFNRLNNFLRQKNSRKFLAYEFEYSDWENEFFKNSESFDQLLSHHFPKLKTRNLTMVEWRKIRQKISNGKFRRFSSNFIREKRIELERCRRQFDVLQENNKTFQLNGSMINISTSNGLNRLMIELKRMLHMKRNAVNELQKINHTKSENQNIDTFADAKSVLEDLQGINETIFSIFDKMESFKAVEETVLIDGVAKGTIPFQLAPTLFQLLCQMRAHNSLTKYNFESFTGSEFLIDLMKIMLEMISVVIERDLLATDIIQFFDETSDNHLTMFQLILNKENQEYVETICLPAMFRMLKKLPFKRIPSME